MKVSRGLAQVHENWGAPAVETSEDRVIIEGGNGAAERAWARSRLLSLAGQRRRPITFFIRIPLPLLLHERAANYFQADWLKPAPMQRAQSCRSTRMSR